MLTHACLFQQHESFNISTLIWFYVQSAHVKTHQISRCADWHVEMGTQICRFPSSQGIAVIPGNAATHFGGSTRFLANRICTVLQYGGEMWIHSLHNPHISALWIHHIDSHMWQSAHNFPTRLPREYDVRCKSVYSDTQISADIRKCTSGRFGTPWTLGMHTAWHAWEWWHP